MKLSPLLALVLVGGCVDAANGGDPASGGKADNGAAFSDVTTAWELTVGYGGDAVVAGVTVQPDGKLLVRSHFPRWLKRVLPDGTVDHTFGDPYGESWTNERSGSLSVDAGETWQVGSDRFIVPVENDTPSQLRAFMLADGSNDAAFGNAGTVPLLLSGNDDSTIATQYDKHGHRVLALVVREWQRTNFSNGSYMLYGPSKLEVIAYDETTGAATSLGTSQMPAWDTESSSPAEVKALVPQPDGSAVVVIAATIYKSLNDPATRWVQAHLRTGHAPEVTTLAVTQYNPRAAGFVALPNGGYDLYLSDVIDGVSTSDTDKKLVRISVDGSLTEHMTVVDAGLEDSEHCRATIATPGYFVVGRSADQTKPIEFTAYPKSGAPIHFKSDKPQRCLLSLSLGPDNHIYAGTWNTSTEAWDALLTSFVAP